MTESTVPFVDLSRQHSAMQDELQTAVRRIEEKGCFVLGEPVSRFEEAFARFCGCAHCVGVSSGTDALHLALLATGVKKRDEVITVSHSFIATALAIHWCGAVPLFVDCRMEDGLMDPEMIEAKITRKTKAIVAVHLYGRCCDMEAINEIAGRHGLCVIEDACQAHGAVDRWGRRAGSFGNAAAFSFYPSKNLGAWGDGGAVVTNDKGICERLQLLRNYGQKAKYQHVEKGFNCRLDTLQAEILYVKLGHLDRLNDMRREAARIYGERLADCRMIVLPPSDRGAVFHLYVIRSDRRDELAEFLSRKGIETGIHYPEPIHRTPAFSEWKMLRLPRTEQYTSECLSLPMFPGITEEEIESVCRAIYNFASESGK